MSDFDPYAILGIPRDASQEAVKKAYFALAKTSHPDATSEADTTAWAAIQEAYELLSDKDKRASFDETGIYNRDHDKIVVEIASGIFMDALKAGVEDPVQTAMRKVQHDLRQSSVNMLTVMRDNAFLEKAMKRLRRKGDASTPNPLMDAMLKEHVRNADKIMSHKYSMTIGNDMLALFATYEFEKPAEQSRPTYTSLAIDWGSIITESWDG